MDGPESFRRLSLLIRCRMIEQKIPPSEKREGCLRYLCAILISAGIGHFLEQFTMNRVVGVIVFIGILILLIWIANTWKTIYLVLGAVVTILLAIFWG